MKTENSRHAGVQQDRSFYGDLHKMSDLLIMLLICVELDKIPLLRKLKQLYKCLLVSFVIDITYAYCTSCTPRWRFISSIRHCDLEMKMLYSPHNPPPSDGSPYKCICLQLRQAVLNTLCRFGTHASTLPPIHVKEAG